MSLLKSPSKQIECWLEENHEILLKNISKTIENWLNENKDEIFDIIKSEIKK